MPRNTVASAWIAGFVIWAAALGALSTFTVGTQSMAAQHAMADPPQTSAAAFDGSPGVQYWLEERDEPRYEWPGAGTPGL